MNIDAPIKILIVEDDPETASLEKRLLERQLSSEVEIAGDFASAKGKLTRDTFDIVVLDFKLPDGDGLELLTEISEWDSPPGVILVTGKGDEKTAASAFKLGALGYVLKDEMISSELPDTVERAYYRVAKGRAENALRDSMERLQDITENALAWIWEVDADGRYTYVSPSVENILGFSPREVLAKSFFDLFPPENRGKFESEALKIFSDSRTFREFENQKACKTGEIVWLSTSGVPVFDGRGLLVGYRGADTDITRQKRAEETLWRNKQDLQDLIDIAAHELRHPATVFKGYAQTLLENWDNLDEETIKDSLLAIDEASNRLAHLVVQLLDTSRIERGKLGLTCLDVNPRGPLLRAVEEIRARGCEQEFRVDLPPEDAEIHADPDKIKETMTVLLDNAVKYSPVDSTIDVSCENRDTEMVFLVADQGPGVPEEDRDAVFERFFRVQATLHQWPTGLGLGLYIAKTIVESHGGWIRVEPREGGGSVFSFSIPNE